MHVRMKPSLLIASLSAAALLAGCATTTPPPPTFNPADSAATQAATFVGSNKSAKAMQKVKKVALTGCNVMFADKSSGSASTGAGMFGDRATSDTRRVDEKIIVVYSMTGLDESAMQKMTDDICADAEKRMAASGLEVMPRAELANNENYQKMLEAGRKSPYEFKVGPSTYKVFSTSGSSIFDPRYIGTVSGLGQAFKQAGGSSALQLETRMMNELGVDSVQVNMLVDFAQIQSDGHTKAFQLSDKDSAKVEGKVQLAVSGDIKVQPASELKCWKALGGRTDCMMKNNASPVFFTKIPVLADEQFYKQVREATTTSDKVASGLTKGLAMLSAMGGVSSTATDITRYEVIVEPAQFARISRKYMDGFMDMLFISANSARTAAK